MSKARIKKEKRKVRQRRIRAKITGVGDRPRLAVFRSNKAINAQIIDDSKSNTLANASSIDVKGKTPMEKAKEVGKEIAKKAKDKKITKVIFDRGGYIYTGKVKALAEGAREGGLEF